MLRTRTQYVWGLSFVDELVLCDNDADANAATGRLGEQKRDTTDFKADGKHLRLG